MFRLRLLFGSGSVMLALAAGVVASPVSAADAYPARAVRMIIPFAAGGGADAVARLLGNGLSERLGQPVIADNRSGAGGINGVERMVLSNIPRPVDPRRRADAQHARR